MKKPNGYGSIFKLKEKRRKPWVVQKTIGFDDNGKQQLKRQYFATQKEANEYLALQNAGVIAPRNNLTLGQLFKEWKGIKYPGLSIGTQSSYDTGWKRLSSLEDEIFQDIRTSHIQKIIDNCTDSKSTKQKIKVLATSLYKYAMIHEIVNKNYGALVTLPKEKQKQKQAFTDLEIATIEKKASVVPYLDTVMILIHTGLRISEFLSLTSFNIHKEGNFRYVYVEESKTEAGRNRVIPIHPKISRYIDKYFVKQNGVGYKVTFFRKLYYRALEEAGVRKLTLHECRHTAATIWAKAGLDTTTIQKMMGHTNYAFTADNYTHFDDLKFMQKEIEKVK